MKQLYLQAQPAALVDEVVGVGEQFMQNLEGLLQKLMRNRGNILWGLCLILLTVLLAKVALRVISAVTGHVLKNKRYQNDFLHYLYLRINYFTATNSTSNTNAAYGGIDAPAPRSP